MRIFKITLVFSCMLISTLACNPTYKESSFGHKLEVLKSIKGLEVLQSEKSMIAVSGPYQARVFASSSNGLESRCYGWFNSSLIESNKHSNNMASLGGESRFWFAPEFGKYSIFFDAGKEQIDENMRAPNSLNNTKFEEIARTGQSITYGGKMSIKNAENFVFDIDVVRKVSILSKKNIEKELFINLDNVAYVGFSAETKMINISKKWNKETGLISLWELGCMNTSPDNRVIIPLKKETDSITEYFTKTTNDRMKVINGVIYYKADANGLNKIGTLPEHTKNVFGSYSEEHSLLNIVTFNFNESGLYLNSLPKNNNPYKGDVINIFNGNVDATLNHNWPFYEFESSSSTKELEPNESINHSQTTYHFEGGFNELNDISKKVLGVNLNDIPKF